MVRWFVDRSPSPASPSSALRRLLPDATLVGGRDWAFHGCTTDPAQVGPGLAYVAAGEHESEVMASVALACERGAACVVAERPVPGVTRPLAVVPDARSAHARLCHALAGDPADRLAAVSIAGGRAAAGLTAFLRSILDRAGIRSGTVGPRGWSDGFASQPAGPGSPGPASLAGMLDAMARRECDAALIEVEGEAHGMEGMELAMAVVAGVPPAPQVGRDVLDACRRANARIVRRVRPGGVVVVDEDDDDSEILGAVNLDAERVSIGIDGPADLRAVVLSADSLGARFRLVGLGLDQEVSIRLGGEGAIRWALAAAAAARSLGADGSAIAAGLEAVEGLPGRLEAVDEGQAFAVRVDDSRTAVELAEALGMLREGREGRLICVVGAEGHGDRAERRRLSEAAEAGADLVVYTTDNPRDEDPGTIFEDLVSGTRRPFRVAIEPDRRLAIEMALSMARPGDAVLIAGKGRHAYQILADRAVPFDDRAVAARWLRQPGAAASIRRMSA